MRPRIADQASLGYAYGASLFSYWTNGAPRPFSATFAVTNSCNISCSYCSCPSLDPRTLDLDQIGVLFSRIREMGVRRLGLAGGEPLVRKDIAQIVRLAKEQGFFVAVNTNLMLYQRQPSNLAEVDQVFTSLDGDERHHTAHRGGGSYAGVLEAIRALVGTGKPVVAICVVTENNLDQADGLLREAEASGFRVHFQPRGVGTVNAKGEGSLPARNEEFRRFWRRLAEEKGRGRPIASTTGYLKFLSEWKDFGVSAYFDPEMRCAAGMGFFAIDTLGDAYPCVYTKGKVPPINLLSDDWRRAFTRKTPCTNCNAGPMLEFNLLFRDPLRAAVDVYSTYIR